MGLWGGVEGAIKNEQILESTKGTASEKITVKNETATNHQAWDRFPTVANVFSFCTFTESKMLSCPRQLEVLTTWLAS